jgi:sulfate adenylyltransferase
MSTQASNGSVLINNEVQGELAQELAAKALRLPQIPLDTVNVSDVVLLATGALSPLQGFMCREDYSSVVETLRLYDGTVFGLPITLAVTKDQARDLRLGSVVALRDADGPLAVMTIEDMFTIDKQRDLAIVFGTSDAAHPGVARGLVQGDVLLGGPIQLFRRPMDPFASFHLTPHQLRAEFARRGWRTIVGFQTRNPIHRAHEYIQKCALEIVDGLLLHPLVGETKNDDVPAAVRMRSYEVMIRHYYVPERVCLAVFPAAMRYAGPREAVFHAMCRRNYGCTHFIVGRDHAGVGSYYGTYDAQRIFAQFTPTELGIRPLMFEHASYCRKCAQMASAKTCPHGKQHHVQLSGTKVRELLAAGTLPPPEVTRPETARVLLSEMAAYGRL